jgi:hypothetical protein
LRGDTTDFIGYSAGWIQPVGSTLPAFEMSENSGSGGSAHGQENSSQPLNGSGVGPFWFV